MDPLVIEDQAALLAHPELKGLKDPRDLKDLGVKQGPLDPREIRESKVFNGSSLINIDFSTFISITIKLPR